MNDIMLVSSQPKTINDKWCDIYSITQIISR